MELFFADLALQNIAESAVKCNSRFGKPTAALVRQRLCELMAADNVAVALRIPTLELRLAADSPSKFEVRLSSELRLIFENAADALKDGDGQLDLTKIESIRVQAIEECNEP